MSTPAEVSANFLSVYEDFLKGDANKSDLKPFFLKDVVFERSGQAGLITTLGGVFEGRATVLKNFRRLRKLVSTEELTVHDVLSNSFAVSPTFEFTPQTNRIAAATDQYSTVRENGKEFRLDQIAYMTVGKRDRISDLRFHYDSYPMAEAIAGEDDQIPNPNMDDVLEPVRDTEIDTDTAFGIVGNWFGTFGTIEGSRTGDTSGLVALEAVTQPDALFKFQGDPDILPFADTEVRQGIDEFIGGFADQWEHSYDREFEIQEFFYENDKVIANTREVRMAVPENRHYDVMVSIVQTASLENGGRVNSNEGIFDSMITVTAFNGEYPFINGI
jgi:hypothetical protein